MKKITFCKESKLFYIEKSNICGCASKRYHEPLEQIKDVLLIKFGSYHWAYNSVMFKVVLVFDNAGKYKILEERRRMTAKKKVEFF